MHCISDINEYRGTQHTAITLGKFDGLHRGHQQLMSKVCKYAKKENCKSVVFVFDMTEYLRQINRAHKILMTRDERRLQLPWEVDYLVECAFTDEIRTMEAETFIKKILVEKFHAKYLVVGTDFTFGYKARGNVSMLEKYQSTYGYQVEIVEKLQYHGREISSTFVREETAKGHMKQVEELLGHPYRISGKVVHGKQLGSTLGIPTMNIPIPPQKLLPPKGVYVARGILEGIAYNGIVNIGRKPTVEENGDILAELHLFSYKGDAYGKAISVDLYTFVRPEKQFPSVEALKRQMELDIQFGKGYFGGRQMEESLDSPWGL